MLGNHAKEGHDDLVICNNSYAAKGTSYSAPGCLAVIQKVMDATGATQDVVLQALKAAAKANGQREVVVMEVVRAVPPQLCTPNSPTCLFKYNLAVDECNRLYPGNSTSDLLAWTQCSNRALSNWGKCLKCDPTVLW
jgi:hypothetical protein